MQDARGGRFSVVGVGFAICRVRGLSRSATIGVVKSTHKKPSPLLAITCAWPRPHQGERLFPQKKRKKDSHLNCHLNCGGNLHGRERVRPRPTQCSWRIAPRPFSLCRRKHPPGRLSRHRGESERKLNGCHFNYDTKRGKPRMEKPDELLLK